MLVNQVPLDRHPLMGRMLAALERAARPPVLARGDWRADILAGPPPIDRNLAAASTFGHLPTVQSAFDPHDPDVVVRAAIYYPGGGGMGWHTNSSRPGWRLYVPRLTSGDPASGVVTAEGITFDRPGYANLFRVGPEAWHAVFALRERWSLGVWLVDGGEVLRQLRE